MLPKVLSFPPLREEKIFSLLGVLALSGSEAMCFSMDSRSSPVSNFKEILPADLRATSWEIVSSIKSYF